MNFIEVLVSMVILSLMLLGLDALQLTTLKEAKANYYLSTAIFQLENLANRLKIMDESDWDNQLIEWNQENQLVLPQGRGTLKKTDTTTEISIFWGESSLQACDHNTTGSSGCLKLEDIV